MASSCGVLPGRRCQYTSTPAFSRDVTTCAQLNFKLRQGQSLATEVRGPWLRIDWKISEISMKYLSAQIITGDAKELFLILTKLIHPKYYKHLKKGAHQSHLGRQKMG